MRWARCRAAGRPRWARVEGEALVLVDGAPWEAPAPTGERAPVEDLLAPATPTKIVCAGRNWRAHAEELGNTVPGDPLIFLKPPSAVVGPGAAIVIPEGIGEVHHEGEMAVVLARRLGPGASATEARAAILGITCANDVTARTIQQAEKKFTRAKGFDTFCPLGPLVDTGVDPFADRAVRCRVNGELRQEGHTREMVFGLDTLLVFIAGVMTLEPGDVVLTGTPSGVGPLRPGDVVEVEVEGVGVLKNEVRAR